MDRWKWPLVALLAAATIAALAFAPAGMYELPIILRAKLADGTPVKGAQPPGTVVSLTVLVPGPGYLLVVDAQGRVVYPEQSGEGSAVGVERGERLGRYLLGPSSTTVWAVWCPDPFKAAELTVEDKGVLAGDSCKSAGLALLSRNE